MTESRIGLLTGPVGVGKTTVAGRVIEEASQRGRVCGGLLTPALLDDQGQKVGIWGLDLLTGERRVLARTEGDLGGPGVGRYSFEAGAMEWALDVLDSALGQCDLLIVDEIGKLELWRGIGLAPVLPRMAAGEAQCALVLVRDYLLSELQERLGDIQQLVFGTSMQNRDELPAHIVQQLLGEALDVNQTIKGG